MALADRLGGRIGHFFLRNLLLVMSSHRCQLPSMIKGSGCELPHSFFFSLFFVSFLLYSHDWLFIWVYVQCILRSVQASSCVVISDYFYIKSNTRTSYEENIQTDILYGTRCDSLIKPSNDLNSLLCRRDLLIKFEIEYLISIYAVFKCSRLLSRLS